MRRGGPMAALAWAGCLLLAGALPARADEAPAALSADGGRYFGPLVDGRFQGVGRIEWSNGSLYEGGFDKGLFSGHGRLRFPTGDVYEGDFVEGMESGHGRLTYVGGPTYVGEFRRDRYEGKGRLEAPDGTVYEGDFAAGVFTGHGVATTPDGRRLEGEFRQWKAEGEGTLLDAHGTRYEGQFRQGELVGKARIIARDGSRYEGEVKRWVPSGAGELRHANGDLYRGHFEYGLYDGQGTLTYAAPQADGRTQDSGVWRYGRLKKAEEDESRGARSNVETALYSQPALLAGALGALAPRKAGAINLYVLAVAGDGSQEVFRREAEYVRGQFDAGFGTGGHSLILVNSRSTAGTVPMATVTSIRQALRAIGAAMDRERDILFLYVTSHGSRDHEISLGLPGMDLPPLSAHELGAALKESGIRWKVVVLSACYAGGFIDELRDPGALILTAARYDRRSFGCADENDFTYFGRAFFKEALPQSDSFEDAFSRAERLIAQWEDRDAQKDAAAQKEAAAHPADQDGEEGAEAGAEPGAEQDRHSYPQMDDPPAIRDYLKRWRAQLPAARAADGQAPH